MPFTIDRTALYRTETFHYRQGWQGRLGLKTGDKAFAIAWKRLLSGEVYEEGPVLAPDGRLVMAHRHLTGRVMLLGESETDWLRGLVSEARSQLDASPGAESPEWTGLTGFLAMNGTSQDRTDIVSQHSKALWRHMEGQASRRLRGDRLDTEWGMAPRPRSGDGPLMIETQDALDMACLVLSKSDIEISQDWLTPDQVARDLRIDPATRPGWAEAAALMGRGEVFVLGDATIPAAMRRTAVVPGEKPVRLPVVHRSALPKIAQALGIEPPAPAPEAPPTRPAQRPAGRKNKPRRPYPPARLWPLPPPPTTDDATVPDPEPKVPVQPALVSLDALYALPQNPRPAGSPQAVPEPAVAPGIGILQASAPPSVVGPGGLYAPPDPGPAKEWFLTRRRWQLKLDAKDGDPAFDRAWKRAISGEVERGGVVLASDGRPVNAKREGADGEMTFSTSEEPWLRGLLAEAAAVTSPADNEGWTSIIGFSAMLGVDRDGTDPISENVRNLWARMEAQPRAVYRGEHLETGYGVKPRPRGRTDVVWLRPEEARDLACEVLSRTDVELSEDWMTAGEVSDALGIDPAAHFGWSQTASLIEAGTTFKLRHRDIPTAIRRMPPRDGTCDGLVSVVHRSALPLIALALGVPDAGRFEPKATRSLPPDPPPASRRNSQARLESGLRQGIGRHETIAIDFIAGGPRPVPGQSFSGMHFWDGGPGKVQLVGEDGKPWAIALGSANRDAPASDTCMKLAVSMGAHEHARSVEDASMTRVDVPAGGEAIPDNSEALFVRLHGAAESVMGDRARRSMAPVATATDPNHLYAVWGHRSFGLMGRSTEDKALVRDIAEALRAGEVAMCARWDTGPVLVLKERIDQGVPVKAILDTVRAQQRLNKKVGYARVTCEPPEGPIVYRP